MDNFEIYKDWVNKFIKYFGLYNWAVYFGTFDDREKGSENAAATIDVNRDGRVAKFNFNTNPDYPDVDPERSAFHEVMELLLIDHWFELVVPLLNDSDDDKWDTYNKLNEKLGHKIIRTLENRIFPLVKDAIEGN